MITWIASIVVLALASVFVVQRASRVSESFQYGTKNFWTSVPTLVLKSLGLNEPFRLWTWTERGVFEGKLTLRQGLFMLVQSFVGTALLFSIWRLSLFTVSEFVFVALAVVMFGLGFVFKKYKLFFSWELPLFYMALMVMSTEWILLASAQLYNSEAPPAFVFLLGDTGWMTLALGFLVGLLWGLVTRSPLFFLILGSLLLLSGFASLHFLVSLFVGHSFSFVLAILLWTSRQSPLGRRALLCRGGIYFLSVWIAALILSLNVLPEYSPRGREFEWLIFASALFLVDHVFSTVFYHFYSARTEKKMKAQ
jgi:hypothetical protein